MYFSGNIQVTWAIHGLVIPHNTHKLSISSISSSSRTAPSARSKFFEFESSKGVCSIELDNFELRARKPCSMLDSKAISVNDEPEDFDDSQFKNKINAILISRETSIKDREGWSKFTYAVEYVFTALSPLAKNLLTATKGAQSVMRF